MTYEAMKRYIKYMMAMLATVATVACHTDLMEDVTPENGVKPAIVLNVAGGELGVDTRADDMADTAREYAISHLDIMIFNDGATDADKELFYYERATAAGPQGEVSLGVDVNDIELGAKYWVYVVANSSHPSSTFENIANVETLFDLKEQTHNLHLTATGLQNTPSHFLMDGAAYMGATEPAEAGAVVIANQPITDVVELNVKLRRAAAKVVVKLISGEKMEFSNQIAGATPGYYVRNTPYETRVMNDGIIRQNEMLETTHESMSELYRWMYDGDGNITGVEVTLYVYSHSWSTDDTFSKATNLLVDIPSYYTKEIDGVTTTTQHVDNYYQVPLTKDFMFERNHYYEVTANVHAPGAEDFSEPVEIIDLKYSVHPWIEYTIDVGGEAGPTYLKVNLDELKMYNTNIDTESLLFSSSSPVTISVQDCYYVDKFGIKRTISAASYNIAGSTDDGSIAGNITVNSDIPTNNTVRYFTLVITNQTGEQEVVTVEQYPLVYIVNVLSHYSYRDDFFTGNNAPTTIYNMGSAIARVSLDSWDSNTRTWSYDYNASSPFWRSKVVVDTYAEGEAKSGYDVDECEGRSDIDYYVWEAETDWRGRPTGNYNLEYSSAQDPGNARMYHVRITATSKDYKLGVPRQTTSDNVDYYYTDPGADNEKLVSPSFMIASRLGFITTGSGSSLTSKANTEEKRLAAFRDHCAMYVEVDDSGKVYDDWRLPTTEELKIIIGLQGTASESADAIDYLLNAVYYYSASGRVFNPGNDDNVSTAPASSSSWSVRCVRDAY